MKLLCFIVLVISCLGCPSKQSRKDKLTRYSQTPTFIKSFLDSVSGGKFLIAEPNETWNSDTFHEKDNIPNRQFVGAILSNGTYRLATLETSDKIRGIIYTLNFKGERVMNIKIEESLRK